MKQIGENLDVIYIQRAQKVRRLADAIEQIGLVTVERLVEQRNVVTAGVGAQFVETGAEPVERLLPADIAAVSALHRADNRRRAKRPGEVDDPLDKVDRL